jgi:hypothetical protein
MNIMTNDWKETSEPRVLMLSSLTVANIRRVSKREDPAPCSVFPRVLTFRVAGLLLPFPLHTRFFVALFALLLALIILADLLELLGSAFHDSLHSSHDTELKGILHSHKQGFADVRACGCSPSGSRFQSDVQHDEASESLMQEV